MPIAPLFHHARGLHEEMILVDGAPLFVRRVGESGPPLLFIHGWADSGIVWRRSLLHWGQRYRAVALDQPGHGRSARVPVAQGARGIAARLAAALDMLDLEEVTLVGHSFGGLMALLMARYHPERIARLVVVDGVWYGGGVSQPPVPPTVRRPVMLAGLTILRPWRRIGAFLLAPLLTRVDERYQDQFRRWYALTEAEPWWLARTVEMIMESDLRAEVAQIVQPTLVVTGGADSVVPPINARLLAAAMPNATVAEIPGAGHHPMEDDFPAFSAALDRFLEDQARNLAAR